MSFYHEFMARPQGIPSGIQVQKDGSCDEIIVRESWLNLLVTMMWIALPIALTVFLTQKINFSGSGGTCCTFGSCHPCDRGDWFIGIGIFAVVVLCCEAFGIYRLKRWLTKTIVRVEPYSGNFSLRRKAPWGETAPMEFKKGTAHPQMVVTGHSQTNGRRTKTYYDLCIDNYSPDASYDPWNQNSSKNRFIISGLEDDQREWLYQLIQIIQDKDPRIPSESTFTDMIASVGQAFAAARQVYRQAKLGPPAPGPLPQDQNQEGYSSYPSYPADHSAEHSSDAQPPSYHSDEDAGRWGRGDP